MITVAVVIVAFNSAATLEACLRSVTVLLPRLAEAGYTVRTVVVDNASTDHSVALAKTYGAEVVCNTANVGFGPAVNRIRDDASDEFLLLINPDAILLDGTLDLLNEAINKPQAAAVGGRISRQSGRLHPNGFVSWPTAWSVFSERVAIYTGVTTLMRLLRLNQKPVPPTGWSHKVAHLNGACLLLRTDAFRAVGGFDERFFLYLEETEMCRRLSTAGYDIVFVDVPTCVHIGGASTSEIARLRLYEKGFRLFLSLDGQKAQVWIRTLMFPVELALAALFDCLRSWMRPRVPW